MIALRSLAGLIALCGLTPSTLADAPAFIKLKGGAYGVSQDGTTVVGGYKSGNWERKAFRWTQDGGISELGDLPGGYDDALAQGVSGDGSVIVGGSSSDNGRDGEAFRWTTSGMKGLGDLPGGDFRSGATGVSADANVIVGWGWRQLRSEAFQYTETGGMVGLGHLGSSNSFDSGAAAVSADGKVIAGYSETGSGNEAVRWEDGEINGLGDLPGGQSWSHAFGVSSDGKVIVGNGTSGNWGEAVMWQAPDYEPTALGLPKDAQISCALAVAGDGATVIGFYSGQSGPQTAMIWTEEEGARSVKDVLQDKYGLDLTGLRLERATAISGDGRVIVGEGSDELGNIFGWVAIVPEPATGSVMLLGLLVIGRRSR